jgi:formylglycine-generating enzyme
MRPGETFKDCRDCPEMVVVPAGSFTMGSPESETSRERIQKEFALWERPRHQVRILHPFALGKYEVTREQFSVFVGATGHQMGNTCLVDPGGGNWMDTSGKDWRDPGFRQTENDPVVCVNWKDAKAYVEWLSRKTGKNYRLLSEAEWEYAARSRTTTARYWGDDADSGCGYANVHDRSSKRVNDFSRMHFDCDDRYGQTAPVGQFRANGFGLHDMLGNVYEWTEDCWHENYNGAPTDGREWISPATDGTAIISDGECSRRVLRGGSWAASPRVVRSAFRAWLFSDGRTASYGFRVAGTLADGNSLPGTVVSATAPATTTPGLLPEGTPREQYKHAFGLLRENKLDQAEVAFTAFIETHGDDPLADNARYWIGETYYVRQDYQRAARTFFDGYKLNPNGPKAAPSLLKLGMSLSKLNKREDACITFAKLDQEFPDATPSIKAVMKRERQRNACR